MRYAGGVFPYSSVLHSFFFAKHLEDDETLIGVVHKHWLLGLKSLFWPTLLLAGSVVILSMHPSKGLLIAIAFWSVILLVWWLRNFFDYYLDAWLVTDQGIVDIAWHGWFHRQSTRVLYSDLQGVSYEIEGVLGTLLRFGTISVEKISTGTAISLEYVRHPKKVEILILRNMEGYLHAKNLKDSKQIQELLASFVAGQMQMKEVPPEDDS